MMRKITIYLLLILLFSQCTKEVVIEDTDIKKQLVPQCLFNPDSLWTVYLQKTAYILNNEENEMVTNGAIQIKDEEGNTVTSLTHIKDGLYKSASHKPLAGKQYSIEVSSTEYPDILKANSYIPDTVDFTVDTVSIDRDGMALMELSFTINDDPDTENYYIIRVFEKNEWGASNHWMTSNDVNIEKTELDEFEQDFSGSYIFLRDEVFNGKSYTLKCEVFRHNLNYYDQSDYVNDNNKVYLIVTNCTKECFRYMLSLEQSGYTYNDPFITPMNLYSNFEQNIGIFAGYRDSKIEFKKEKSN